MSIINLWPSQKSKQIQFDHLVRPHLKKLYQLAYRFTGNAADAEDMVQDVMLKLYPRTDELAQIERLGAWLAKILYRHNIDIYRKQQRSALDQSDGDDSLDELQNKHAQPAEFTQSSQTQLALSHALNQLNVHQQDLIILHDIEGYTLAEISQIIETPIGTLKSRLSRSRTKLREILSPKEPFD